MSTLLCVAPACTSAPRCAWDREPDRRLDLTRAADQKHLRSDAQAAEEIAVRMADRRDAAQGHRAATEQCERELFASIARVHHVTPELVRVALGRQNDAW